MEDWENDRVDVDFSTYLRNYKKVCARRPVPRIKEEYMVFGTVKGARNHKYNQRKVLDEHQGHKLHKLSGDVPAQPKAKQTESDSWRQMKRLEEELLDAEGTTNHLCQEVFELKQTNIQCRAQMKRLVEEVDEQRRLVEQAKKHIHQHLDNRYKDVKATNEENVIALARIREQLVHGPQTSLTHKDGEDADAKLRRAKEQNDLLRQELEKMRVETSGSQQEAFHLKMTEGTSAVMRDRHTREECLLREVEELQAQLKKQESYNHQLCAASGSDGRRSARP